MKTYWQAEIYQNGELYDIDFPERKTVDEALADVQERYGSFTELERCGITGGAAEWRETSEGWLESTSDYEDYNDNTVYA